MRLGCVVKLTVTSKPRSSSFRPRTAQAGSYRFIPFRASKPYFTSLALICALLASGYRPTRFRISPTALMPRWPPKERSPPGPAGSD